MVSIGAAAALGGWSGAVAAAGRPAPLVFGHRGASALRPEHTLASYQKAIEDGADFVEPDLVVTKDGVLIARHENNIVETTDVAAHPEFASRKAEKIIDGQRQVGWFVEDFTLAELKTLRARERLPQIRPDNARYDGMFEVPTWAEIVIFVAGRSATLGRPVGLVPELKHSTYFRGIGLPLEDCFLDTLRRDPYLRRAPIEVQSFEVNNLRYLRAKLGRPRNLRLFQLTEAPGAVPADIRAAGGATTYGAMTTAAGLAEIARYADVIGPPTRAIIPLGPDGKLDRPTSLVADAHRAGLVVRPWTFRPENSFLAADFRDGSGPAGRNPAGSQAEILAYLATGIDGFFTDDPAIGRAAVAAFTRL